MFSIIIPTWNNLDYLKLCVDSIRRHSGRDHEILVHVNDGGVHDRTREWVRSQRIRHTYARQNLGVCVSVNYLAAQASRDWLLYLNDDMVCCPGWDEALIKAAQSAPSDLTMFFSQMIEPVESRNPLVIVQNFGRTASEYDEKRMLAGYMSSPRPDILGQGSQPTLVHRTWWQIVGGYSLEYGPGMSSDDDLLMKFWIVGCRHFRIVSASRVYHFSQKSTGRVRRNAGGRTFVMKWGITQKQFKRRYLAQCERMVVPEQGAVTLPHATTAGRMKRIAYGLGDYPLGDLAAWDPAPGRHIEDLKAGN